MQAPLAFLCLALIAGVFSGALFTPSAYAYLDPGTGSIILQAVIASVLGSLFALKMFWARIVNFFKRDSGSSANPDGK